jgi:hypothetical protein
MANETTSKFWYEVVEYPENLAPVKHKTVFGKAAKAKARRQAKLYSELGNEVILEGYDVCETWRNGKKV